MSPGLRAAAELARDPARADALIAAEARCTPRTVQRQRRALERRGVIPPVPSGQRQHAWAAWPGRNPGAAQRALEQLALDPDRSTRAIALAARCTPQTVRQARRAQVHNGGMSSRLVDRLRSRVLIKPDDHHAPPAATEAATRVPPRYTEPPDEIELACPGCTLAIEDGEWQHDRSCIFRPRPADGRRAG